MLSLALVLFLVAALAAEAAPQAKPKETEADKLGQMVTISGECTKLVHAGQPVEGCKSILVNMNYSTGVSGYWFTTQNTIRHGWLLGSRSTLSSNLVQCHPVRSLALARFCAHAPNHASLENADLRSPVSDASPVGAPACVLTVSSRISARLLNSPFGYFSK